MIEKKKKKKHYEMLSIVLQTAAGFILTRKLHKVSKTLREKTEPCGVEIIMLYCSNVLCTVKPNGKGLDTNLLQLMINKSLFCLRILAMHNKHKSVVKTNLSVMYINTEMYLNSVA